MQRRQVVRAKRKLGQDKHPGYWGSLSVLGLFAFALYATILPGCSGFLGKALCMMLQKAFGLGRFLTPALGIYAGLRSLSSKPWPGRRFDILLLLTGLITLCAFLAQFGDFVWGLNLGGACGLFARRFLTKIFGAGGAFILTCFGFLLILLALCRKSPVEVVIRVFRRVEADITEWKAAKNVPHVPGQLIIKPRYGIKTAEAVISGVPPAGTLKSPEQETARKQEAVSQAGRVAPAVKPRPVKTESQGRADNKFKLPGIDLLNVPEKRLSGQTEAELTGNAGQLERTLANFNITAKVVDVHPGPVITRYDLEPAPGVKLNSIVNLSNDIALALRAGSVRMVVPVPGKGALGIEIPNKKSEIVFLSEIISSPEFASGAGPLNIVLGKTAAGSPYVTDISDMPHLLIAGSTGSGKSVCVHSLIVSLLYRARPDQCKIMLIDPKRLELTPYNGIPHLYDPRNSPENAEVITRPRDAAMALEKLVKVMDYRYEEFARANVRNIEGYNQKKIAGGEAPEFYLVVVIDEFADLMLTVPKEVEDSVQRLAQMARAVGIHLVLATQRPSVDVITGVIKANLPSRIALRVSSQTDSRVILDASGAESLLGQGDMLFLPSGSPAPVRIQGAFVSESEVEAVADFVRAQGVPSYVDVFGRVMAKTAQEEDVKNVALLCEALNLVLERKRISQDLLKARFGSSAKATNILSLLEVKGFIHKPEGTNRWEIYFERVEEFLKKEDRSQKQTVNS